MHSNVKARLIFAAWRPSTVFAERVESVWGVPLPLMANTASGPIEDENGHVHRILWLGPDEWLAVCAGGEVERLHLDLDEALAGEHVLVSDVSHSRVLIVLEGEHARDVLLKGCSLDLDPIAFGAGHCAQAPLARSHMLLHQVSDLPRYHLYIHRSVAAYAYAWLEDAAQEFL
jgi:sarcosine oxidase subunit gamma